MTGMQLLLHNLSVKTGDPKVKKSSCATCGGWFVPAGKNPTRYCDHECRKIANNKARRAKRAQA